jgi:hypothetical protein
VRRILALVVVAAVGAGVYGVSGASSGLRVGTATVSASTMRSELASISASVGLQCYLTALAQRSFASGSGGSSLSASGAAAWTGLRVEGLAIEQYVDRRFHFHPSAAQLAAATASLEGEMSQAAAAAQYTCAGGPVAALAAMTPEMRAAQVDAQAASLELVSRLDSTIPTTTSALEQYYASHPTQYDTLCVSAAVVEPSKVTAFQAMERTGASIAALVAKYSIDAQSAAARGALGCYAPSNQVYANVRADLANSTPGRFPTSPVSITYGSSVAALFLTATKVTPTPFASAEPRVLADVTALNTSAANTVKERILFRAHVSIDPSLGRWGLSSAGAGVFAPGTPKKSDVTGASVLSGTSGATYK